MQGVPGCTGAQQKIARAQEQPGERVGAHAISRVKPNQPNAQIPFLGRKIAGRIEEKIEKKGLTAAVTGRAGLNYHLCCRQQRTKNSKWRIRRKTRDWSPSCSADWRKYKTDITLPLQWRTMKIKNARTIENRTYSTSPGQKTVRHTIQPEESLGFTRGNT